MAGSYYNENDPGAAAWLRELIGRDLIEPGDVDERSICDVRGSDLAGYERCHFFAGIGGWPLALRLAGWTVQPVWTGSCPCPPFSAAGKKKACPGCQGRDLLPHPYRTGVFACCDCGHEWTADARHLWPEFHRLIADRRPPVVFGEQVAGADGLVWLAGVRATLEILGYGFGAADMCAAGCGAPHIRQRLYWVAESASEGQGPSRARPPGPGGRELQSGREGTRMAGGVADAERAGVRVPGRRPDGGTSGGMQRTNGERERLWADAGAGRDALADGVEHAESNGRKQGRTESNGRGLAGGCIVGGVAFANGGESGDRQIQPGREHRQQQADGGTGFWSASDAIPCRDGNSRRVESGTFPLAHGISGRVGRLRGYGNAIVPQVAAEFIRAYSEARESLT